MNRLMNFIVCILLLLLPLGGKAQDYIGFWSKYAEYAQEGKHEEIIQLLDTVDENSMGTLDRFYFDFLHVISYNELGNSKMVRKYLQKSNQDYGEIDEQMIDGLQKSDEYNLILAKFYYSMGFQYLENKDLWLGQRYLKTCINTLLNRADHEELILYRNAYLLLGILYVRLFDYSNAISCFEGARIASIANRWFDVVYTSSLSYLGSTYLRSKEYLKAKMYLDEAYYTLSEIPDVGQETYSYLTLPLLVECYAQMGYLDDARKIGVEGINYCRLYNLNGLPLCNMYSALGNINIYQQDYVSAKSYFKEAAKIGAKEKMWTAFDRILLDIYWAYAQCITDDPQCAKTLRSLSTTVIENVVEQFTFMSNNERSKYWDETGNYLTKISSMLSHLNKKENNGLIYNNTLFSKGLLLRTLNQMMKMLRKEENTNLRLQVVHLQQLKEQQLKESLSKERLYQVKDSIQLIEKQLSQSLMAYQSSDSIRRQYSWKQVKAALAPGEAAIEFVALQKLPWNPSEVQEEYAALILRYDAKMPEVVFLCKEDSLAYLKDVPEFLENTGDYQNLLFRQYLYGTGVYKHKRAGKKALQFDCIGQKLYQLVWEPLAPYLNGIRTVYYSSVGVMNAISMNAVSDGTSTLSEKYAMHLLSSTSELSEYKKNATDLPQAATIYGGINYNTSDEEMIAEARGYDRSHMEYCAVVQNRGEGERSSWGPLPGSEVEAKEIAEKLTQHHIANNLLIDSKANEESFKALSGHSSSLLHIATHGFFYSDDRKAEMGSFLRGIRGLEQVSYQQNIMNHSGILFSGANKAWKGEFSSEHIEDGILTADEISRLDLSGTDIVVLSACETGLGKTLSTEGVFGLQRAFKLAGVKTIVMSLWMVPDEETSKLMQLFYDNWLGGMDKHEAFARAQQLIKQQNANPYYWAGFVMLD